MFKKMLLVGIIFIGGGIVFAQQGNSVDKLSGFNWVTWSMDKKVGFIEGFMTANFSAIDYFMTTANDKANQQLLDKLSNIFYIPMTVGQIGAAIDTFYSDYSNRKFYIWLVFLTVTGKDYWNAKPTNKAPSTGES